MSLALEERLDGRQISAIQIARSLAQSLAQEHPEIADSYRTGKGYRYLAYRYLRPSYWKSPTVARRAVGFALKKLLDSDERERLRNERFEEGGKIAKRRKLGILNPIYASDRAEWGRDASRTHASNGTGCYGPDLWKQALKARGFEPYTGVFRKTDYGWVEERGFILLARLSGDYDGYGGWSALTDQVNRLYGNARTPHKVEVAFCYWLNREKTKKEK